METLSIMKLFIHAREFKTCEGYARGIFSTFFDKS